MDIGDRALKRNDSKWFRITSASPPFTVNEGTEYKPTHFNRLAVSLSSVFQVAVAFVLTTVVVLANTQRNLAIYDEGLILAGAMRLLHGDVVHRDFYSPYGPGQFAVVAMLFRMFGESFLVERLYDAAVKAAIVCQ